MLFYCWVLLWNVARILVNVFLLFQAEDGIRDSSVTGVQTCALPICRRATSGSSDAARNFCSIACLAAAAALWRCWWSGSWKLLIYSPVHRSRAAEWSRPSGSRHLLSPIFRFGQSVPLASAE